MNKTTVIHHSADFDGIFCREIARKFLPAAELVGWDYADEKIPFPEGQVYVLDLSPDCFSEMPDINEVGRSLIWIDHHKSAIEKYPSVIPGYRIDGVAACRLAWQWFSLSALGRVELDDKKTATIESGGYLVLPTKEDYITRTVSEPVAVRLAGEYDIWDKRDPRSEVLQFGLRSRELTAFDWGQMLSIEKPTIEQVEALIDVGHKGILERDGSFVPGVVYELIEKGELLKKYQQRNDAGMMGRSFVTEWEGLKFLSLTTARCNSLTFASKDVPETGHDALMGFYWNGTKWAVSLYHANHRKEIDLSQIAVKHGGGGHRGACGFTAEKLPFLP